MRSAAFAAALLALCAAPAGAQPAAPPAPHEVSPLVIMPGNDPPKVTATYPAAGQAVAPGVLILTVTFSQRMVKDGADIGPAAGGEAPDCLRQPRLLDDGKTFAVICRVAGGKSYAVAFNGRGGQGGFANEGQVRAVPATVAFTTSKDDPIRSLDDALKAAGLHDVDLPIQDTPVFDKPAAP